MPPRGRPITMPGPVGDLARIMGLSNLCEALMGVSTTTVRRWAHGEDTPRAAQALLLDALFRKYRIDPPSWTS